MRSAGRQKLGYYPLPPEESQRLRSLFHFSAPSSVVDPCAGTGKALLDLTAGAECSRFGIELDAGRAAAAQANGVETIHGSTFDTHSKVESFSFLYLNPPYDSEVGPLGNQRMEYVFLEHTYRWLIPGGVLLFVIPFNRLRHCIALLAAHFTSLAVYGLTDEASVLYQQIAVTGIRKHTNWAKQEENRTMLSRVAEGEQSTLSLEVQPHSYAVPPTPHAVLTYRGLPLDAIEDLVPRSSVWKQVAPFLLPKEELAGGRPITPLHGGHVGVLCTAGLLNGVFGQGPERHIARWRSIKHVNVTHETENEEKSVTSITRKRERFSSDLTLLYEDGRTLYLGEAPAGSDTEPGQVPVSAEKPLE